MQRIRPHLGLARHVRISNVWLLARGDERFLIDTGHPAERFALWAHLRAAGIRGPGDLTAVILTHRHSDHAGNAAWLRGRFDCPIVCHRDDEPFLTGREQAPKLASPSDPLWARVLCHIEDNFGARTPIDDVLEGGEQSWGFRVFHTPGHTAGSVVLHDESTQTLFAGDSVIGGLPLRAVERLRLPLDEFSDDGPEARASMRALIGELPPTDVLCSGHGPAIEDDPVGKIKKLAHRDILRPRLRIR